MKVASGLAKGIVASPDLATEAVATAMDRAGLDIAQGVLLFLSSDFASQPQAAVTAASRAANCLQVAGCTSIGLFTEEEWLLDVPAAAAMVFGDGAGLRAARAEDDWRLAMAAPNAVDTRWLDLPGRRFGAVSGDASGQGPYTVWSAGRLASGRRCELAFEGGHFRVDTSRGIQPLTEPHPVERAIGQNVHLLGGQPALDVLARVLPLDAGDSRQFPLHLVMAGILYGETENAIAEGRYHLLPILSTHTADRSVALSGRVRGGDRLFWAIRQPLAAERDMRLMLDRCIFDAPRDPAFGLCFACMSRGPYFYGGVDRDLEAITRRFPGMPLLGFYGNGEFSHLDGGNRLLQYATVLALHYPGAA
ncbi:histidine kinase [Parasulfuritortus cantonensis]|uniref:Histidine kinase n=1 Tax=Parasulfuritortus cantonensis TaxID=2528202 RepID=A0A4V2NWN2_9PROT|nr:FIST C-terminal domain-containing protein [Parasulfuritortus cantonensis]TCJ18022.1 histidine kinase [Parasulfuritortus cantonensis]